MAAVAPHLRLLPGGAQSQGQRRAGPWIHRQTLANEERFITPVLKEREGRSSSCRRAPTGIRTVLHSGKGVPWRHRSTTPPGPYPVSMPLPATPIRPPAAVTAHRRWWRPRVILIEAVIRWWSSCWWKHRSSLTTCNSTAAPIWWCSPAGGRQELLLASNRPDSAASPDRKLGASTLSLHRHRRSDLHPRRRRGRPGRRPIHLHGGMCGLLAKPRNAPGAAVNWLRHRPPSTAFHRLGGERAHGWKIRPRTVFATHYHELNKLASVKPNASSCQVLVEETGNNIRFLHQVIARGGSSSYGIEAARLVGVPNTIVRRT